MSGVSVSTVQRATVQLRPGATVLELLQALTENLGGEWDDARLSVIISHPPTAPSNHRTDVGGFTLVATMDTGDETAREPRWETEDGEHVAVQAAPGDMLVDRVCCCGEVGTNAQMAEHLKRMAGQA